MEDRISAVLNAINPAAAGKYFEEDYILTPSDQTVLRSNLSQLKDIRECNKQLEENLKKHFARHFCKSEKVLAGYDCGKAFHEETIGKIRKLNDKIAAIDANLCEKLETCPDMFKKTNFLIEKTERRGQWNKIKEKPESAKLWGIVKTWTNFDDAFQIPNPTIDSDNFNLEALANLTDYQLKYLKMLYKNGHLTTEAVTCIQEYVKNFPAEMEDLIQVSDDDDNQNPEDCNDSSDVDGDIEREYIYINDADNNDIDVGNDTPK